MNKRQKPFGEVLIDDGVITHDQLDEVLNIQLEHPQRTIGEIVSTTFSIPMEDIETIFAQNVLVPSIQNMLTNYLKEEARNYVDASSFSLNQLIYEIDVVSITLKRTVMSTFVKVNGDCMKQETDSRKTATEIGGKLRLNIKTSDEETICQPMDMISYVYEFETGKAEFETSEMDGIRFLFSRKIREQTGEIVMFQPVSQDELEKIIKEL